MSEKKLNLGRRKAMKIIATTAATVPLTGYIGEATVKEQEFTTSEKDLLKADSNKKAPVRSATDPDLLNPTVNWELLLSEAELATLGSLCEIIIPSDAISPSASALGAHHYINEYVSAPYDRNKRDLVIIRGGIVWLNSESHKRYGKPFIDLVAVQKLAICNDIKWVKTAKAQHQHGAHFFAKVRDLTATAFYTTLEGMADIGYMGNKPSQTFEGAPLAVLQKLGLDGNV